MDHSTREALQAIAATHRSLADTIDQLLRTTGEGSPWAGGTYGTTDRDPLLKTWDPEVDSPLVPPKVVGTREEQDWCSLTYLSGVYAINRRYDRGANRDEIRHYALKAGYRDGRAVTAWSKGNGATQNDRNMQRWVNSNGVRWVADLVERLSLALPDDLRGPWDAPTFHEPLSTPGD